MSLPSDIEAERTKYLELGKSKYGTTNHARPFYEYIKALNIRSILDVGCGRGQFSKWCKEIGIRYVFAADFALGPEDKSHLVDFYQCDAGSIPTDRRVEYVTAFDVLEHILPNRVPEVLEELSRLSTQGALFTIATRGSVKGNVQLHMTVKKLEWWIEQIYKYYQPWTIKITRGGMLHCVKVGGW